MFNKKEPFLIGVAGGISSGKSTVCKNIIQELEKLNSQHPKHILIISLDSFYKKLTPEELAKAERGELNLDHPSAFDDQLALETLTNIIQGKKVVEIPIYDKKTYAVSEKTIKVTPDKTPDIIILEGILAFYFPEIREMCQMKLFVDCDADTRLSRRVLRDMNKHNRPLETILSYYQKYVKPTFEEFCLPTKKYADVIIPRGAENLVAINLIVQHLNDYLSNRTVFSLASPSPDGSTSSNDYISDRISESLVNVTPQRSPRSSSSNLSPNHNGMVNSPSKSSDMSTRPH